MSARLIPIVAWVGYDPVIISRSPSDSPHLGSGSDFARMAPRATSWSPPQHLCAETTDPIRRFGAGPYTRHTMRKYWGRRRRRRLLLPAPRPATGSPRHILKADPRLGVSYRPYYFCERIEIIKKRFRLSPDVSPSDVSGAALHLYTGEVSAVRRVPPPRCRPRSGFSVALAGQPLGPTAHIWRLRDGRVSSRRDCDRFPDDGFYKHSEYRPSRDWSRLAPGWEIHVLTLRQ